jgi:hypothetical protein
VTLTTESSRNLRLLGACETPAGARLARSKCLHFRDGEIASFFSFTSARNEGLQRRAETQFAPFLPSLSGLAALSLLTPRSLPSPPPPDQRPALSQGDVLGLRCFAGLPHISLSKRIPIPLPSLCMYVAACSEARAGACGPPSSALQQGLACRRRAANYSANVAGAPPSPATARTSCRFYSSPSPPPSVIH